MKLFIAFFVFVVGKNVFGSSMIAKSSKTGNTIECSNVSTAVTESTTTATKKVFTTTFSTTSKMTTTTKFLVSTTIKPEMIRRCTMAEVDGCSMETHKNSSFCRKTCENELEYFGKNGDKMSTCFDNSYEAEILYNCLVDKIDGFYTINDTEIVMIPKTNYSNFLHPFNITEDPLNVTTTLMKKARTSFIHFRKFQRCVVNCMRNQTVNCFHRQNCDVKIPNVEEITTIFNECRKYKKNVHDSARKSCYSLLTKQHVTKLAGTCGMIGSPISMKML